MKHCHSIFEKTASWIFCHSGELQDHIDDAAFTTASGALPTMPYLPQDEQELLGGLFEGKTTLEGLSERIDNLMKVPNPVPALIRYIFHGTNHT